MALTVCVGSARPSWGYLVREGMGGGRKRGECLAEGLSNVRVLIQMYNICQRPPVLCSRGRSSMLVLTVEVDSALGTTQ